MSTRFFSPRSVAFDTNGDPISGAKLYFYEAGTSTPLATYSDSGLTAPNTNPVIASSAGRFGEIWLTPSVSYKVVLADASDVIIWTADPYSSAISSVIGITTEKTVNYTATTSDIGSLIPFEITVDRTLTLPAIAGVSTGAFIRVRNSSESDGTLTIDGASTETVNEGLSQLLRPGEDVTMIANATGWYALGVARREANGQIFTTAGNFTAPAGVYKVKATVTGGGGSGASCIANFAGGGGGAGGTAIEWIDVTPGDVIAVTVGAGGAASASGANNGAAGGDSTFGAFCTGQGGLGGTTVPSGGAGNTATGGTMNIQGGDGGDGDGGTYTRGGDGGASYWGGGGRAGASPTGGLAGKAYGSGGGGGYDNLGNPTVGGAGKDGVVVVEW